MGYGICFVINKAKSHVMKTLTAFSIIMFAGLVAKKSIVIRKVLGPAISTQVFLVFSDLNKLDYTPFQKLLFMFLTQPSPFQFLKITPPAVDATKLSFKL
jgi:hypothetical protein